MHRQQSTARNQHRQSSNRLVPLGMVVLLIALLGASALPAPATSAADGAWTAQYYANPDLVGLPAVTLTVGSVNFDWGRGSPHPSLPVDNFSVRWSRQIDFTDGRYTFFVRADDGVRLYVDDQLLIDDWRDSAGAVREGTTTLSGRHSVTLEYYEHTGLAQVHLWWEREPTADRLVGNLITCMRPQNSWIKVYRLTPAGNWEDMNPQGWGPIDQSGYRKIDGLPIDPYYGHKGQPYRVELWANGSLIRSVGNIDAGQPEFRIYPFTDTHTPWGCPAP